MHVGTVLQKGEKVSGTGQETLFVWRVFWNFQPMEPMYGNTISLAGLESTEPHFVQTRTFNLLPNEEDFIEECDAGKTVSGIFDNSLSNSVERGEGPFYYATARGNQGQAGIMLWPLTKKALTSRSDQYKKAAVMCRGVATLYMDDVSLEEMRNNILTGVYHFMPGTLNNLDANRMPVNPRRVGSGFLGQVLEVYQSSVRIRIIAHTAKEYPWTLYEQAIATIAARVQQASASRWNSSKPNGTSARSRKYNYFFLSQSSYHLVPFCQTWCPVVTQTDGSLF